MINFELPVNVAELQDRTAAFVRATVIPAEARDAGGHGLDVGLRAELQAAAKTSGVFAPHVPAEYGGLGLDVCGQAAVFEEAGYSILGPQALNCAAPDEGNMHMLSVIATPTETHKWAIARRALRDRARALETGVDG